jgi:hypothetical protein
MSPILSLASCMLVPEDLVARTTSLILTMSCEGYIDLKLKGIGGV